MNKELLFDDVEEGVGVGVPVPVPGVYVKPCIPAAILQIDVPLMSRQPSHRPEVIMVWQFPIPIWMQESCM